MIQGAPAAQGKIDLVVPYEPCNFGSSEGRITTENVATLDGCNHIAISPATAAKSKSGMFAIGNVVTSPES